MGEQVNELDLSSTPQDISKATSTTTDLVYLERARAELVRATYTEARELRDRAEAVLHYVRRVGVAEDVQNKVAEIKVRAERRLGELLASMPRRRRGGPRHDTSQDATLPPTLDQLGVTRSQSSRWQLAASVPEKLFESYVAKANGPGNGGVTSAGVLRLARKIRAHNQASERIAMPSEGTQASSLEALIAAGDRFACIYADPPWQYGNQGTRSATDGHYPTMCLDDIASLPVAELAAENAHLHLWVTSSFLFEAEFILRSWGFDYRSSFVWVKPQLGLGNYWRCAHEFLLLGVRGNARFQDHSLRSWIREPRGLHSEKPEVVRSLIEQVSSGPYLELFGRRSEPGWTVWGNQLNRPDGVQTAPKPENGDASKR